MSTRIFMLAYKAEPEIAPMTQQAVSRALESTGEALMTLAINGGETFSVEDHERLTTTYWADRISLGEAYNSIIRPTTESYICLLHNDCLVPRERWLGRMVAVAEKHGFAFPEVLSDTVPGVSEPIPGFPPSCCYVISREAWNELGGFDPIYAGCHFEDTDLFMRGKKAGYRLALVPEVTVYHRRGMTRALTAEESNVAFQQNKLIYSKRWGEGDNVPLPQTEVLGNG